MSRFVAAELFCSAVCNLRCTYCFIPKDASMAGLHERAVARLGSGALIEDLSRLYGEALECIALWGTEPGLVLPQFVEQVELFLQRFPRLREIKLSTNLLAHPEAIVDLARTLRRATTDRQMRLDLQFSLDGPAWITDACRRGGATETIVGNLFRVLAGLDELQYGPGFRATMHCKPTVDAHSIAVMVEDPVLAEDYFGFFDRLFARYQGTVRQRDKLRLAGSCAPTLVVPGRYTSDDGRVLARFFALLRGLEETRARWPRVAGSLNNYADRLSRLVRHSSELPGKATMFTCSAGDSQWGIGLDGERHICHETFFLFHAKYREAALRQMESENWHVGAIHSGRVRTALDYFVSSSEAEAVRTAYVMRCFHDYLKCRMSSIAAAVWELSLAGQASPCFLRNRGLTELLALFLATEVACPATGLTNAGSVNLTPLSLVRLWANGAFEVTLRHYLEGQVRLHGRKPSAA